MAKRKYFPEIQAHESKADFEERQMKIQSIKEQIKMRDAELNTRKEEGETFVDDDDTIQFRFSEEDVHGTVIKIMDILGKHDIAFVNHVLRIIRVAYDTELADRYMCEMSPEDVE